MSAKQIRVGDIGTRFLLTVKEDGAVVDLSGATTLTMSWFKPDKNVVQKTMTLFTNGLDGKVYYDTILGDLDMTGIWKYQLLIATSTGTWRTDIQTFHVYPNIS